MEKTCNLEHIVRDICHINQFTYVKFIAAGAFKETYHVCNNDIHYALKIFKANNVTERVERELSAMKRLDCPNIAKLVRVDSFEVDNKVFLYSLEEYLSGGSLGDFIKNAKLDKKDIISIGYNLISALEVTHSKGIVHRDIKPDNIIFRTSFAEAVLVDFGLVRDLNEESLTQAFHCRGPGTPLYSSPEQLNNEKELIDWRSDQFALGITLCEALLREHPFASGHTSNTVDRIAAKKSCNESIKNELIRIGLLPLVKMLEVYPISRYRTPELLKADWNKLEV